MANDKRTITCVIQCRSPEHRRLAEARARAETALDNTVADAVLSFSNGNEGRTTHHHRLTDYFDRIQVEPGTEEATSFRIVFHLREEAGRFWKNLMVNVLHWVRAEAMGASIREITQSA